MRTTLDIDSDVLQAAKDMARRMGGSTGAALSVLARRALTGQVGQAPTHGEEFLGFQPFAAGDAVVTNEAIDAIRGDDAY